MKYFSFHTPLVAFCLAMVLAMAAPANSAAQDKSAADTVQRIETYLTGLRSIESDFVQSSSNGGFARGRIYVRRPKSLRLDYQPPSTMQIYANGFWLIYADTELEEVTQVPVSRTPAAFLMGDTVSLSGAVEVIGVEQDDKMIRISLVQSDEPEAGSVSLTFGRHPLALKDWTVIDAHGVRTRVGLVRPSFNRPIDGSVFEFDPDQYLPPQLDQ